MTTKQKIIGGFLLMMLLLAGVATLGYRAIQSSSSGFTEYRRLARFNIATSDMETYLTRAAYSAFRFLDTRDPAFMKLSREAMDGAEEKSRNPETMSSGRNARQCWQTLPPAQKLCVNSLRIPNPTF